jgi:hypothetical protein
MAKRKADAEQARMLRTALSQDGGPQDMGTDGNGDVTVDPWGQGGGADAQGMPSEAADKQAKAQSQLASAARKVLEHGHGYSKDQLNTLGLPELAGLMKRNALQAAAEELNLKRRAADNADLKTQGDIEHNRAMAEYYNTHAGLFKAQEQERKDAAANAARFPAFTEALGKASGDKPVTGSHLLEAFKASGYKPTQGDAPLFKELIGRNAPGGIGAVPPGTSLKSTHVDKDGNVTATYEADRPNFPKDWTWVDGGTQAEFETELAKARKGGADPKMLDAAVEYRTKAKHVEVINPLMQLFGGDDLAHDAPPAAQTYGSVAAAQTYGSVAEAQQAGKKKGDTIQLFDPVQKKYRPWLME